MSSQSRLEELLDRWEEERMQNPQRSLDEFVIEQVGSGDQDLVIRFRQMAEELADIDKKMDQVVGRFSTLANQIPNQNGIHLSTLRPGLSPISGTALYLV